MDSLEIFVTIIASILSGLVGGLFTFLGVKATIKNDTILKLREEELEALKTRPELKIDNDPYITKFDFDANDYNLINSYIFLPYDLMDLDSNHDKYLELMSLDNLVYKSFTLRNIGKTEIKNIYLDNNYVDAMIIIPFFYRFSNLSNLAFAKKHHLNYNNIKYDETFSLIVIYNKDREFFGGLCPETTLIIEDINGRKWSQNISFSQNKVESTERI